MVLLAVRVVVRPVVLAPLALRAPGTLNAGRGASQTSRRARRRVRRLRLAELLLLLGLARGSHGNRSCGGPHSGALPVRVKREVS